MWATMSATVRGVARPVAEPVDRVEHRPHRGLAYLVAPVEHPGDRADPDPGVGRHVRDGDAAIGRRGRRTLESFPHRRGVVLAPRGGPVGFPADPAGALAQPQRGRHQLAGLLTGPVVELPQRPRHHLPGDVVDWDGHSGQPRVHQGSRGAAVEAGDREVLADPQPELRGHAVDHPGEPVAAGHNGVRPQLGAVRGQQRPDLPARVGVVHLQHVGLVGGNPAGGQPVPEPGGPVGVPVVRRPVADEGDPPEAPGQHVVHGRGDGPPVVDVDPVLRQRRAGPAEARERHPGFGQQLHPRVVLPQIGEQERVYALAGDQAAHLVPGVPFRDHDHQAVALPCARRRQRLQELLHDVVAGQQLHLRHDVGELPGPARAQAPRAVVRVVAERLHRRQHPGPGGVPDPSAAVEHVRDGLPGYRRGMRHVLDRYLTCGRGLSGSGLA
jgi:hypothetical protein